MLGRFKKQLFIPIDPSAIALFRVAFGLMMAWEMWRHYPKGWIQYFYMLPKLYFSYPGFEWIQPWPGDGMYVHFLVTGIAALGVAAGLFYRLSTTLLFLGFTYVFLLDQTHYLNHFYLLSLISFLMIFIPAANAFSIDSQVGLARSETIPQWTLWILRFQLSVVYVYGGFAKLNEDWFLGEPMRSFLASHTDFPLIGQWFHQEWMIYFLSYSGLLFDLFIVPLLLWRRTFYWALPPLILFHLFNARFFVIGVFPWFMLAATTLFFKPDWPRRFFSKLSRSERNPQTSAPTPTSRQTWICAGLGIYALFQLCFPLRHYFYPGNVGWTGEGERFAWQMKLAHLATKLRFFTVDPSTHKLVEVEYPGVITKRQAQEMQGHPEMIAQMARFLAKRLETQFGHPLPIYAEVLASLNGRPVQLRINPKVDLARPENTRWASQWVLPLEHSLNQVDGRGGAEGE